MYSSLAKLQGVLLRSQHQLTSELTRIDEAYVLTMAARDEKIRQLRRELSIGLQLVTRPLDDIEIPAITIRRLLDEEQKKMLSRPTYLSPQKKRKNRVRFLRLSSSSTDDDDSREDIIDNAFKGSRLIGQQRDSPIPAATSAASAVVAKSTMDCEPSKSLAKTFYVLRY